MRITLVVFVLWNNARFTQQLKHDYKQGYNLNSAQFDINIKHNYFGKRFNPPE